MNVRDPEFKEILEMDYSFEEPMELKFEMCVDFSDAVDGGEHELAVYFDLRLHLLVCTDTTGIPTRGTCRRTISSGSSRSVSGPS